MVNGHGNLTDVQLSIKALQEVKAGGQKVIRGSHICVLVGVAIQNGMIVMGGMKNFQSSVKLKEVGIESVGAVDVENDLFSYWNHGSCGPMGDGFPWDWCNRRSVEYHNFSQITCFHGDII